MKDTIDAIWRFVKRYGFDVVIAAVGLILVVSVSMVAGENLAIILRKIAAFGAWSVLWYLSRVLKVGVIDWWEDDQWRKIYAVAYMASSALVFALS
jgi:hypothetical protein